MCCCSCCCCYFCYRMYVYLFWLTPFSGVSLLLSLSLSLSLLLSFFLSIFDVWLYWDLGLTLWCMKSFAVALWKTLNKVENGLNARQQSNFDFLSLSTLVSFVPSVYSCVYYACVCVSAFFTQKLRSFTWFWCGVRLWSEIIQCYSILKAISIFHACIPEHKHVI